MEVSDTCLRAISWFEVAYCYRFGCESGNDAFWHFTQKDNWKFAWTKPEDAIPVYGEFATDICDKRRSILSIVDITEPRALSSSDPFAWFSNNGGKDIVTGPTSIMLNNACRSESIQRFQVASTYIGHYMTVEMFGLKIGEPRWFFLDRNDTKQVLWTLFTAFPQVFCDLKKNRSRVNFLSKSDDDIKKAIKLLGAFRIVDTFTILKYERFSRKGHDNTQGLSILLQIESELSDYRRGRCCWSIPIPGKPTVTRPEPKPDVISTPLVVIKSPRVAETLQMLSRVWQDRFLSTVLITAPPGSGKEHYAASIAYGSGRGNLPFHTIALSVGNKILLEKQIFGLKRDDGSVAEGLIAKSKGGTLFLDEVHQPPGGDGVRASLLRALENDVYYPVGSSEEAKVNKVLFVMATSRRMSKDGPTGTSGDPLSEVPPPDFWTRMAHILELPHPLSGLTGEELKETIECFFKHFWWERVTKAFDVVPFNCQDKETTAKTLQREQAEDLLDDDKIERASKIFSACLNKEISKSIYKIPTGNDRERQAHHDDLSIRGIRSMVSNLVSMSTSDVLGGQEWFPKLKHKRFRTGVEEVVKKVLPVALIKPNTTRKN